MGRSQRAGAAALAAAASAAVLESCGPSAFAPSAARSTRANAAGQPRASGRGAIAAGSSWEFPSTLAAAAVLGIGARAGARGLAARRAGATEAKEAKGKSKVNVDAKRGLEMLFRLGKEVKQSYFAMNAWYETADGNIISSQERVFNAWQTRPTRTIEKTCDGKVAAGCTWIQMDGKRGVAYIRFDQFGKVSYIREVIQPGIQFENNTLESLSAGYAVMNGIGDVLNFNPGFGYGYIERKDERQVKGLVEPKSRRASDVVQYLWQEATQSGQFSVDSIMREYSENCVYEDVTLKDDNRIREGFDAVKKYQEDTKKATPANFRWIIDEWSDGKQACTAVWHVEFNNQRKRGLSFYEFDQAGKVCYVRTAYDLIGL